MVPGAVVVPAGAQGTGAAIVDVVGGVPQVPGAEVAVVEEELVAVEGARHVLVDEPAHPRGGAGLEPDGHAERKGVESGGGGGAHPVRDALERCSLVAHTLGATRSPPNGVRRV